MVTLVSRSNRFIFLCLQQNTKNLIENRPDFLDDCTRTLRPLVWMTDSKSAQPHNTSYGQQLFFSGLIIDSDFKYCDK